MSSLEQDHYFTVEEVNALIPRLEEHFQNFWAMRQSAQTILQELRSHLKESQNTTPRAIASHQIRQSQAHFLLENAKKELDTLMDVGCVIKDLEIGQVDFPYILESSDEAYICWKFGEKKVRYWHGLDEGFSARKPFSKRLHFR